MRSAIIFSAVVAFLAAVGLVRADGEVNDPNVVVLTPSNFDSVIDGSKHALVEFYAPWCGHCKALAPTYGELADGYTHVKDKLVIAKVNADEHKELGGRFGVQGFPTLKFFPKGSTKAEDYTGGRSIDDFVKFLKEKTGLSSNIKKPQTFVTVLDESNFDEIVLDSKKDVLVEFYAPWCGHCKALAPTYEKVARDFATESNCVVANLDADKYRDLGGKYGIQGFPTIKFFAKGADKKAEDYAGGRSEQDFVDFLNEKCGTKRTVGGGLKETAGRIASLDKLVKQFNEKQDVKVIEEAKKVAGEIKDNKYAAYYWKVMEKVVKDKGFVAKELARLERILKGELLPEKADDFAIRSNILKTFDSVAATEGATETRDEL